MAGYVQFRVYADPGLRKLVAKSQYFNVDDYINVDKEWRRVNYNVRWTVKNLLPDRKYFYQVRTRSSDRSEIRVASNINSFKTAPLSNADHPVEFVAVGNLDPYNTEYILQKKAKNLVSNPFASMLNYNNRAPDFILLTGDTVYYDDNRFTPDVEYPKIATNSAGKFGLHNIGLRTC